MSSFDEYREQIKSEARFKLSVLLAHIAENPKITVPELARLMYTTNQAIDHWMQDITDYIETSKVKYNNRTIRGFTAINLDKYNWGERYKRSDDPRREYFMDKYKDLPVELREAIFAGKISKDVVRVYHEGDLDHTYTPHKPKKAEYGIPSLMGEL